MKLKKTYGFNVFLKLSLGFILLISIFIPDVYGYWSYNKSCEAFPDQCEEYVTKSTTPSLCPLIINAASFYIKSVSDFQLFLREVEISGGYLNFTVLQELIDKAIYEMKVSNSTYYQVWQFSNKLEYVPAVLEKLRLFDYPGYQKENNLNPAIFGQVVYFLKAGDIKGTYQKAYNSTSEILKRLEAIKSGVYTGTFPKISECWRLNQLYLETALFGQYVSEIFYAIE